MHREQVYISLSGIDSSQLNYVFEVYRLAVRHHITGYIKRRGTRLIEIVAQGTPEATGVFVNHLQALGQDRIKIEITTHNSNIVYNEFRILTFNEKNTDQKK